MNLNKIMVRRILNQKNDAIGPKSNRITNKFILISGMSIKTCPVEALDQISFFKLINNKYLVRWCSQNNVIKNYHSIIQIPLGLD